jgi:hypothetical protein
MLLRSAAWRLRCAGCAVALGLTLLLFGCDSSPGPSPVDAQPPRVADFRLAVEALPDPPDEPLPDSLARVQLDVALRAADDDGRVTRVELTLEPSQAPASTLVLRVPPAGDASTTQYATSFGVQLPVIDDIYTVRAYAIDNDSLLSNQVRGQFRVRPASE